MDASIIIPAYNEQSRIGSTLARVSAYLASLDLHAEILVVDDGSTDDTVALIRRDFPAVRLIESKPNRGKGFVQRIGLEAASGNYRLVMDADCSTPIESLTSFLPVIQAGADLAIGSRAHPEARIVKRQSYLRECMGRTYNLILRSLALTPIRDTQCGFKVFTPKACDLLLPRQTLDGFGVDTEWICIAQKQGLNIAVIPVEWHNHPASRVHIIRDSCRMLLDALRIRLNLWRGRYD